MRFPIPAALLALGLIFAGGLRAQPAERGRSDAATYAAAFGVPLEEARRRLALQPAAGRLDTKLRVVAGEIFAGLWLEHEPRFVAQVRFTDPVRGEEILRRLAGDLDLEFAVGGAGASQARLEALQREILRRLREPGPGAVAADVDLDLPRNRVEIFAAAPAEAARALDRLAAADRGLLQLVPVAALAQPAAASAPGPLAGPALGSLRGGRALSSCTTGFPARDAAGRLGVLSAGHCPEFQVYRDYGEVLPWAGALFTGGRDVAFYQTSPALAVGNELDAGLGPRRVLRTRGRDEQPVGALVCRHGMTTAYRCGRIVSKRLCPAYVPACAPTFVRVGSLDGQPLSSFGDSGGPWFLESEAYGIHSGHFGSNPDAVYMAIDLAWPLAAVLTGTP